MDNTERIQNSISRNPSAPNHQIAKNLNLRADEVAKVRESMGEITTQQDQGLLLSKLRVLPRRPAESAAKYIKRLPLGRGFDVRKLAQEWAWARILSGVMQRIWDV